MRHLLRMPLAVLLAPGRFLLHEVRLYREVNRIEQKRAARKGYVQIDGRKLP